MMTEDPLPPLLDAPSLLLCDESLAPAESECAPEGIHTRTHPHP